MSDKINKLKGSLVGLACGDAVGTTVEFKPRGSFEPMTDMIGGGPFNLKRGEWTDDTSMALCLAQSLIESNGFDAADQMRRYCDWYRNGYMSSNGRCFDIGNTVRNALEKYRPTLNPFCGSLDRQSAGNGSIMRLAPIVIFYYPDRGDILKYASESSRTTHGAKECLEACVLLALILHSIFAGETDKNCLHQFCPLTISSRKLKSIASGDYRYKDAAHIKGSGYVVESLEAALYCFYHSDSYRQAILMAANLGDDADTTAAICGQIAGAYYGLSGIPQEWVNSLAMSAEILKISELLINSDLV